MNILGVETSCDETSAAVVRDGHEILANVISSQVALHRPYGGVVPELASRQHLRLIDPVIAQALAEARLNFEQIDAVAATYGPGLASSLLIGLNAAKGIAFSLGKPFVAINHVEAHLYSPVLTRDQKPTPNPSEEGSRRSELRSAEGNKRSELPSAGGAGGGFRDPSVDFPLVSLVVSGGHTILAYATGVGCHEILGQTVDDAAGEAFDKVAKLLGLGYPGGPEIDRLSAEGDLAAIAFPRSMLDDPGYNFSFSGVKTSVLYYLRKNPGVITDHQSICDVCASFQEAVVEVLVGKLLRAAADRGVDTVSASGGVSINRRFRERLGAACRQRELRLCLAEATLCTDNAAMIAALAFYKLPDGASRELSEDVAPSVGLA